MALLTADFIIFAINSAIRFNRNIQRIYADSIESQDIILPLPKFRQEVDLEVAKRFFSKQDAQTGGAQFLAQIPELGDLHHRLTEATGAAAILTDEEEGQYREFYQRLYPTLHGRSEEFESEEHFSKEEIVNLYRVRQLAAERKKHKPLAFVAGSLVKIGIDYFSNVSGALNQNSTQGRILKHFLAAIDDIPFDDPDLSPISNPDKLAELSRRIVPQLFAAATESIGELSPVISGDPKVQKFISATSKEIASDIYRRLDQLNADPLSSEYQQTIHWGKLILHSTIANSGQYVVDAPGELLDTNAGTSALIKATGGTLLDAILKEDGDVKFSQAFNPVTIDRTLRAAFGAISEHPGFITRKRNGFREVLVGVSKAMAGTSFQDVSLLPELTRQILLNTAKNLALFHKPGPDGPKNILIIALEELLKELSVAQPDGSWRPRLGKRQLLAITNTTLDAVVDNPNWIEDKIRNKPVLSEVVRISLKALAGIPEEERLRPETFQWLLQLSLRTVTQNPAVLDLIEVGDDAGKKAFLQKALDLIFHYVFVSERIPLAARIKLMTDLVEYALTVILSKNPNERGLILVDLILFKSGVDYSKGFDKALADDLVAAALQVLATHPELVTKQVALGQVIAGIAGGILSKQWEDPDFLMELVRLCLEYTALNAQMIVDTDDDDARYLLVVFIRELLLALAEKEDGQPWVPDFTAAEALSIVEKMIDTVIDHPEWLIEGPDGQIIFRDVSRTVMSALRQHLASGQSIDPATIEDLLELALRTAAMSAPVLKVIPWGATGKQGPIMEHALDLLLSYVFGLPNGDGNTRLELLTDMLDYMLDAILIEHPDDRGLLLIELILFSSGNVDYSQGLNEELASDIVESALQVVQTHTDLITGDQALTAIFQGMAKALDDGGWQRSGLLPELVRLALEQTAVHSQLVIPGTDGKPSLLVVEFLQSLLTHLSKKSPDGRWHPQLSGAQLLTMAESMLDSILIHPHWLIDDDRKDVKLWDDILGAVFDTLVKLPAGTRIQTDTLELILVSSLRASANSDSLLEKIKWKDDDAERSLLNRFLDRLVAFVYPQPDSSASTLKTEQFLDLLEFSFSALVEKHPNKKGLLLLDLILATTGPGLPAKERLDVDRLIDAGLSVINTHPELVAKPLIFQKIVADIADALRADDLERQHLVPEFFRLVLEQTAGNLDRLMKVRANSPKMILVTALSQTLKVITQKGTRTTWRPRLTDDQVLDITEYVLWTVVHNPAWVKDDKIILVSLEAIWMAIGEVRAKQSIPYSTIRLLVFEGLKAVGDRKQLAIKFIDRDNNEKQIVLGFAMESLLIELYDEHGDTAATWTLTQRDVINAIITHYLARIAVGPADKDTVDNTLKEIHLAADAINQDAAFILDDLLEAITKS